MFKVGDLVKHKDTGWLGHILEITDSDIHIRIMYEPSWETIVFPVILLFPSQLEFLEKVL